MSRLRYKVERVNAWMDNYRDLVVRYERKAAHYFSYCDLAAMLFYPLARNSDISTPQSRLTFLDASLVPL